MKDTQNVQTSERDERGKKIAVPLLHMKSLSSSPILLKPFLP